MSESDLIKRQRKVIEKYREVLDRYMEENKGLRDQVAKITKTNTDMIATNAELQRECIVYRSEVNRIKKAIAA